MIVISIWAASDLMAGLNVSGDFDRFVNVSVNAAKGALGNGTYCGRGLMTASICLAESTRVRLTMRVYHHAVGAALSGFQVV